MKERPSQKSDEGGEGFVVAQEMLPCLSLGAAYGTKGGIWGRILLSTPTYLKKGQKLWDEAGSIFQILRFVFKTKGRLILFLDGVVDRSQAEAFRAKTLFLPKSALPALAPEEFYTYALIGCTVVLASGATIGHISDTANFGAGDLLEVATEALPEIRFWLPFREAFVQKVDLKARQISISEESLAFFGPEVFSCTLPS
ncbi:MAG: ribosome maturation factor RimM [Holosporales bacterium]|jgi:16S rRNA processing protein RimM|nr:ribosome maturation factor RimM [Holosporales bacterium]